MNKKSIFVYVAICVVLVLLIICEILPTVKRFSQKKIQNDTIRVVKIDTVVYRQPKMIDSVLVRYERVRFTTSDGIAHEGATDSLELSNAEIPGGDSAWIELPITQKRYEDSIYTVWVSGYQPKLDSIRVYQKSESVTINNAMIKRRGRWGVGLSIGVGVTTNHGVQPYVGLGVGYRLFDF